jgi:DNA-directed RNA polymerase subunit alpha
MPRIATELSARIESLSDLESLEARVFESHATYEEFLRDVLHAEEDAAEAGSVDAAQASAIGTGFCLAGRARESGEWLDKGADAPILHFLRGRNYRALGEFDRSNEEFQLAMGSGVEKAACQLEMVETHLDAHRLDAARDLLEQVEVKEARASNAFYLRGVLRASEGEYVEAIDLLEQAVDANPRHTKALFKLAFLCDLYGDDDAALDTYQVCNAHPPVHINALINLAVLHKDRREWDQAERCLQSVLETVPDHARASLFLRDVTSSRTMNYDEDHERTIESRNALLDMPISEFELSVRSRNCLKRMQIHTLGDLLRTSENELLAYKNFGETSLGEIKAMLTQKGLRLGQLAHEGVEIRAPLAVPRAAYTPPGNTAILNKPVSEIELSVRSRKCLQRLGINTLGELASRTEAELLGSKNFGVTSLTEIKQRLVDYGISLRKLED